MKVKSNYVIFRVGDNDFGIEIQYVISIEKVTEITCLPQMPDYIKGITNLRGQMKGVIDAATLLFNQSIEIDESTRFLLLDIHQSDIALMVSKTNEILSIDEEEIKPIDSINATSEIFKGVALIDNRMISILNIEKLLSTLDALETVSAVHLG
ncbi:purine-binding chemotaxis protein CheW [Bacillus sp. SAJ1]|nr:chemotaxis protein CheW [Heyndrickxia shackletonii]RTZ54328.1 purine-binding chemotaxis protein CheW [Bacillus sp. SAJ1]